MFILALIPYTFIMHNSNIKLIGRNSVYSIKKNELQSINNLFVILDSVLHFQNMHMSSFSPTAPMVPMQKDPVSPQRTPLLPPCTLSLPPPTRSDPLPGSDKIPSVSPPANFRASKLGYAGL